MFGDTSSCFWTFIVAVFGVVAVCRPGIYVAHNTCCTSADGRTRLEPDVTPVPKQGFSPAACCQRGGIQTRRRENGPVPTHAHVHFFPVESAMVRRDNATAKTKLRQEGARKLQQLATQQIDQAVALGAGAHCFSSIAKQDAFGRAIIRQPTELTPNEHGGFNMQEIQTRLQHQHLYLSISCPRATPSQNIGVVSTGHDLLASGPLGTGTFADTKEDEGVKALFKCLNMELTRMRPHHQSAKLFQCSFHASTAPSV